MQMPHPARGAREPRLVTAVVCVSPVSAASSWTSWWVSALLMLRLMIYPSTNRWYQGSICVCRLLGLRAGTLRSAVLASRTSCCPRSPNVPACSSSSRRSPRPMRPVTSWRVARKADAVTPASQDREQRGRVGQQQARAPVEPQQVRLPVLRIRCRRRLGDRRAQDSQELSRAPQDHCAIVRRGAASRWPGSSAPGAPAQGRSITPRPGQSRSLLPNDLLLAPVTLARPPAQARHPGGTPIRGPCPPRHPGGVREAHIRWGGAGRDVTVPQRPRSAAERMVAMVDK